MSRPDTGAFLPFSIKNGVRIMGYSIHNEQFLFAFVLAAILPGVAFLEHSVLYSAIWTVGMFLVALLARCWDDPAKLGYENEKAPQSRH